MKISYISQLLLAATWLVCASSLVVAANPGFTMKAPTKDTNPQVQIIGGRKADPAQWPATFVFANPAGGGCTSTAVGERTIITAAHCIPNGATGIVEVGNRQIQVVCTHHPVYRTTTGGQPDWEAQASPDFALCSLAESMPGGQFENIDSKGAGIVLNREVHLLGFGCNQPNGVDGAFGVLFEGDAPIIAVPAPPNYYTYTNGVAVCYGDSGGGAYQFQGIGTARRLLVAINSRGNISTLSLLSTTKESGFISWATTWAQANNTRICGIHNDAKGCRPL